MVIADVELLKKIANLCNEASDTICDDNNHTTGTGKILSLCDDLADSIDKLLEEMEPCQAQL